MIHSLRKGASLKSKAKLFLRAVSLPTQHGHLPRFITKAVIMMVSLYIDSRQSVAFTGRSGCGKSTALQLLLRFYRVNSGSVEVDDKNITDINVGHLRESIGYVGQMPVLFAGSIRDNIKVNKMFGD